MAAQLNRRRSPCRAAQGTVEKCTPRGANASGVDAERVTFWPCGLKAASMFDDSVQIFDKDGNVRPARHVPPPGSTASAVQVGALAAPATAFARCFRPS